MHQQAGVYPCALGSHGYLSCDWSGKYPINRGRHETSHVKRGDATADQLAEARAKDGREPGKSPSSTPKRAKPKAAKPATNHFHGRDLGRDLKRAIARVTKAQDDAARQVRVRLEKIQETSAKKASSDLMAALVELGERVLEDRRLRDAAHEKALDALQVKLGEEKQAHKRLQAHHRQTADQLVAAQREPDDLFAKLEKAEARAEAAEAEIRKLQGKVTELENQLERSGRRVADLSEQLADRHSGLGGKTNGSRTSTDIRAITKIAKERGFKVRKQGNGHLEFTVPVIRFSGTPSDVKAIKNLISDFRRLDISRHL